MELKFEVFEDEENQWGLRIDDKEIYCGDLLGDIDSFLKEQGKRILASGDTLKINLK